MLSLDPYRIASDLGKLDQILALPRFAHQADSEEALDGLAKARELVEAIRAELELMKRPRFGEPKLKASEQKWREEIIDGTYALTSEWQESGSIMERRRILVEEERPGPEVSMRTHIAVDEREIHEELATRLSRDPREFHGLVMLKEAQDLAWNIFTAPRSKLEGEDLKSYLLDFVQLFNTLKVLHWLTIMLIAELEKRNWLTESSREHPSCNRYLSMEQAIVTDHWLEDNPYIGMEQAVFTHQWPQFSNREWSLLRTALRSSCNELDPFLEYLEIRDRGRSILSKWYDWRVSTRVEVIYDAYSRAGELLRMGIGTDLLDEIDETGKLSAERFERVCSYLGGELGVLRTAGARDSKFIFKYVPYSEKDTRNPEVVRDAEFTEALSSLASNLRT